jgi:two-component system, NtrC family, response regulator HydG
MATILVVDDNETVRDGVATVMHRLGHQCVTAATGEAALKQFLADPSAIDLTITDLRMDGMDGMKLLAELRAAHPTAMVMMITAHGNVPTAVEAMRSGAWDFVEKPFSVDLLRNKVGRALEVLQERRQAVKLSQENQYLREQVLGTGSSLDRIIGSSPSMDRVFRLIRKVAPTDSTVHIYGESGTGKELVATAIHELSSRAKGPFVKVNCGALTDSLLESELFGHEKGAFTDAMRRHVGRFELAEGGTLFLDEIGDISTAMQVKLLRVLQERTYERVGGDKTMTADVRVVTATNRDLQAEVATGKFREDLYYRLHIIPLTLPPLRERREDVQLLVEHFIHKLAPRTRSAVRSVTPTALEAMQRYGWPGNVRQLENIVEQALVFAEGDAIEFADLPAAVTGQARLDVLELPSDERPLPEVLEDLERQLIVRALRKAGGVKTETARILGIKTPTLYYKLEKYGLAEASES